MSLEHSTCVSATYPEQFHLIVKLEEVFVNYKSSARQVGIAHGVRNDEILHIDVPQLELCARGTSDHDFYYSFVC